MMDQEHATHQHNGPGMHVEDSGTSTEVSFGVAIVSESHQLLWSNLLKIANLFRLFLNDNACYSAATQWAGVFLPWRVFLKCFCDK